MQHICKATKLDVDILNRQAAQDSQALIRFWETAYQSQLKEIAAQVGADPNQRMVMIAGPSASGKTTTSAKLRAEFARLGVPSVTISLDDFLYDRNTLPFLPDGSRDYDSIATLDLDTLKRCIGELLSQNSADLPVFDFVSGVRLPKPNRIEMGENDVVILEGIHALNPLICDPSLRERFATVYVSLRCEFYRGEELALDSHSLRLIRRMIRDYKFRGSDPENTFRMWGNVRKAEEVYITPYRDGADYQVNTIHGYEPFIYHHDLLPLLRQVPAESEYSDWAGELVRALSYFDDLDQSVIPKDSMIREFVG